MSFCFLKRKNLTRTKVEEIKRENIVIKRILFERKDRSDLVCGGVALDPL